MAGILDLLNSDLGKNIISGVAGQTGQDESKTSGLLTMALPVLMQAMQRNAATPEGAQGLMSKIWSRLWSSFTNVKSSRSYFNGGIRQTTATAKCV